MAKIQDLLNSIMSAVYGKDVRQSIHDSIKQCYDDVTAGVTLADASAKKADTATKNANDAITKAQTATTNANNATSRANTSVQNADVATSNANNAADNANTKATLANEAAGRANTAADDATNAAQMAIGSVTNVHAKVIEGVEERIAQITDGIAAGNEYAAELVSARTDEDGQIHDSLKTRIDHNAKELRDTKAPAIERESSGSIVTVDDAAAMPVHGLVSQIVPVQAGSGDPSLENVRAISGRNAVTAKRTGKNLIDVNYSATSGSVQFDAVNNVLTVNGTDTSTSPANLTLLNNIKLKAGTYSLSTHIIGGSESGWSTNSTMFRIYKGTSSNTLLAAIRYNGTDTDVFTLAEDTTVRLTFLRPGYTVTFDNLQFTIQLELGSEATEFEPPNVQTLTAALPKTVYGGTLDWKTGVLMADHALRTLDGTENWGVESKNSTTKAYFFTKIAALGEIVSYVGLCDRYTSTKINMSTTDVGFMFISTEVRYGSMLYVRPDLSVYPDVESWKAYLAEQANPTEEGVTPTPMQVVYKLTNPETIQLTPQQMDMLKGTNNVWSDCGDTSLMYVADTKTWGKDTSVALIGATENGMVATKNYSIGDFIVDKETLTMYRATAAIAVGEAIIPGTNCTATTVVEQLAALYNLINA